MMERKIGDVIEYDGQKFQIMKGDCEKCYFINDSFLQCCEVIEGLGSCYSAEREDAIFPVNIYYKLIEE